MVRIAQTGDVARCADATRDAAADLGLRLRSLLPEHTSLADVFTATQPAAGDDLEGDGA